MTTADWLNAMLLGCAVFNIVVMPVFAWQHGCRLNEAARNRDGRAARHYLLHWFLVAIFFAASVTALINGGF